MLVLINQEHLTAAMQVFSEHGFRLLYPPDPREPVQLVKAPPVQTGCLVCGRLATAYSGKNYYCTQHYLEHMRAEGAV